jgi:uncharacterized protein (DUF1499 family)
MFVVKWLLWALVALGLALLLAGRLGLLQGREPTLGVRDGRLKPPSKTPNSVTSQAALHPDHPMRARAEIAPLPLSGSGPETIARIQAIVEAMSGSRVVKREPDYLYVQFTSRLLRFVDDTEFWFDPAAQVVQVRSSSRIGHGDRGVNRARVDHICAQLSQR